MNTYRFRSMRAVFARVAMVLLLAYIGMLKPIVVQRVLADTRMTSAVSNRIEAEQSAQDHVDWPVIAAINDVGNNADESVEFTLDACTALRIYAVGEGSSTAMKDYGEIERVDTGQVIWTMYYFEATDVGHPPNVTVDRAISLPAGTYRLHFHTNYEHAYNAWTYQQPEEDIWGITLYEDQSPDRPAPACWERAENPEDLGWSSRRLARFADDLDELNVAAFMIITDGKVVFEYGNVANNFKSHSTRKSLMSGLYGVYVAEGNIDTSKTLEELGIDDKTPLTDAEKRATILDLLMARSGVYIPAAGEAVSMKAARPERGSHSPGTYWYYNNWDFNALATIFEQETGSENVYTAFDEKIARPLGMQDYTVELQRYRYERSLSVHPNYSFRISARDFARYGQLFLQNGTWQDETIIPVSWVEASITAYSNTGGTGSYSGYGYMWWIAAEDCYNIKQGAYAASGYGGHAVEILPELNTVIVLRVNTDDPAHVTLLDSDEVDFLINKALVAFDGIDNPRQATGQCAQQCARSSCGYSIAFLEMLLMPLASTLLLIWGGLIVALLAYMLIDMIRRTKPSPVTGIAWTLILIVFGPLGLLAYGLSYRRQRKPAAQVKPVWVRAFAATLRCVAANIVVVILLISIFVVFVASGDIGPLLLVVPLIAGWMVFSAPLAVAELHLRYGRALLRTFLPELMRTLLALAAIVQVISLLDQRWYPYSFMVDSPLFYLQFLIAAFVAAVFVYPLNLWIAYKGYAIWPYEPEVDKYLNLRKGWGALLIVIAIFIGVVVFSF